LKNAIRRHAEGHALGVRLHPVCPSHLSACGRAQAGADRRHWAVLKVRGVFQDWRGLHRIVLRPPARRAVDQWAVSGCTEREIVFL